MERKAGAWWLSNIARCQLRSQYEHLLPADTVPEANDRHLVTGGHVGSWLLTCLIRSSPQIAPISDLGVYSSPFIGIDPSQELLTACSSAAPDPPP